MQKTMQNFPAYPDSDSLSVKQFAVKVNAQLAMYRGKKGTFSRAWVMEAAKEMPAYLWWDMYGSSCPELQQFSRLVLAQPGSASIIQRINSEFAFVKDRRRNRLAHAKANQLVSLFHNLRLLKRMNKPKYVEPTVGWNDDDMKSGVTKWGIASYS